jgi:DNA-binding Lrp family transcriptional regulator
MSAVVDRIMAEPSPPPGPPVHRSRRSWRFPTFVIVSLVGSLTLDHRDRQLVHALQIDGRAPLARIAEALDVSDRTLARRYRALKSAGMLRVRGLADGNRLGQADWLLRARCTPATATPVTAALARRPDTSWVCTTSAGTELTCIVRTPDHDVSSINTVATMPGVTALTAHRLLRRLAGEAGWPGRVSALDAGQIEQLRPPPTDQDHGPLLELTLADRRMLSILAADGRTDHRRLATAVSYSESTVRRRLTQLRATNTLSFSVETDARLFGHTCEAVLWLNVAPAGLTRVAHALAGHREVAFAAATAGPANLVAVVVCPDTAALYDYLTTRLATVRDVHTAETTMITNYAKRAGPA